MKWPFSKFFTGDRHDSNGDAEKLARFFTDESVQNSWVPKAAIEKILAGASVDEIQNSFGEFGVTLTNPIPTNGAIGQVVYLSSLRHLGKTKILFHRLGSFNAVDIYETVTVDGKAWNILYLDMYHPRKSKRAPEGYSIASGDAASHRLYGVNYLVPNFPYGLSKAVGDYSGRLLGPSMVPAELRRLEEAVRFVRPDRHIRLRDDLEIEWVRRPGTYAEVAKVIVDLALQEVDRLLPAYKTDIGKFLADRGMLDGKYRVLCESGILTVALTACIAATWRCSVYAGFGARDAGLLAEELNKTWTHIVAEPDRVVFDEVYESATRAAIHALKTSAEATGIATPSVGIADALLAVVLLRKDASEPVDLKLTEEFIMKFHHPFHHRTTEIGELKIKFALAES